MLRGRRRYKSRVYEIHMGTRYSLDESLSPHAQIYRALKLYVGLGSKVAQGDAGGTTQSSYSERE